MRKLGERVRAACKELATASCEHNVVVVSHVSPIKAAVAWSLGLGDELAWRLFVAPGSISRIDVRDGRTVLQSFDETAHLDVGQTPAP